MSRRLAALLQRFERIGRGLESAALVALLSAMILLAAAQIVLRDVFDRGLLWADELLRLMVLWLAMLGALAASRDARQINIDVLTRFLSPGWRRRTHVLVCTFTALVSAAAACSAAHLVHDAWAYEDPVLGGLPAWPFQAVLPAGFGLIAWRYLVLAARAVSGAPLPGAVEPGSP